MVDISKLKPHPKNRNKHPEAQIARLAEILKYQGFRYPIKVSKLSGFITSGHGRLLAAKKLGLKKVPVNFQPYDSKAQEYADLQADNAIALWAELDLDAIGVDVKELGKDFNLDMLGFQDFNIPSATSSGGKCDEDEIPEKVPAKTKLGDLYELGNHRLLCGDSTDIKTVERLMGNHEIEITFTSPPYNAGVTPKDTGKYLDKNDDRSQEEYLGFLESFTRISLAVSKFVFVNIQSIAGNKTALIDYLHSLKGVYADTIVWDKTHAAPAMAKNVLNSRFEYIHIFSAKANRSIGTKEFRGTIPNVLVMPSNREKELASIHKATFPVSFSEYFIQNFCINTVFDPFGGTGTTLIACEKTKRQCFTMELDPRYCDVIVARWEKYTGQKAKLITKPKTILKTATKANRVHN